MKPTKKEGAIPFDVSINEELEKEFDNITKLVSLICQVPVVAISLINGGGYCSNSKYRIDSSFFPFFNSICLSTIDVANEFHYVEDISEDSRFKNSQLLKIIPNLVSYLGYPIIDEDDTCLGIISLLNTASFTPESIQKDALKLLSEQTASIIKTSSKLQSIKNYITEKEENMGHFVTCVGSGTWVYDLEADYVQCNEKWAEQIGYHLNELEPMNFEKWESLVHPHDFKIAAENLQAFILDSKDGYDVEFRMRHKNGDWKWIRSVGVVSKVSENGAPLIVYGTHTDIDYRKKIEIALLEEKERFQYAVKATSDILWDWNVTSNTIIFGEGYKKLSGYGPPVKYMEHAKLWEERLHPDDRKSVVNSLKEALETEVETWEQEYRIMRFDKTYAYVSDKALILRDENGLAVRVVGAFQDITLRKESELQLKVFQSIIDKTKDSIIITKAEPLDAPSGPEIIYVNEAVVEKTGYSKEELVGNTPRVFQGPNTDLATLKYISDKLRKWEVIDVDIINYSKSKKEYWINLSIVPVADENGYFKYWISVQKDITDRKIYERSLTELNEKLQKNAAELEITNAELEQFAYVTSHDLQEPLRMVTSFLTQLERKYGDVLDEKGKTYIHFAVDGAKRMRQLILDLLDYSRAGKLNEPLEDVNLDKLLLDVIQLNDRYIKEKNATITVQKLPNIKSFYTPLRQVFLNLINNALKYSSTERKPEITISAQETKKSVKIVVKDNGIGIKKEYLEKIFIIFQRLYTKEEYSGTGIGLAITKKLMEQLGGKIYAKSIEGKGSEFIIEITKK